MSQDRGSVLFADNLQDVLDAAGNAGRKGTAQWSTPEDLARHLAKPLGMHRPVLCDLTCGHAHLLRGAANQTTDHCLGLDIAGPVPGTKGPPLHFAQGDLGRAFPLMVEADFRADIHVLNPPWDLHWHRSSFMRGDGEDGAQEHNARLAKVDPRLGPEQIDSAIATWLVALDRCTRKGEGLLLMNAATFQRLVMAPGAPYECLRPQVWALLEFDHWLPPAPGTPATRVACIWWTAQAQDEPPWHKKVQGAWKAEGLPLPDRYQALLGTPMRGAVAGIANWKGVAHELERLRASRPEWNIWMDRDGSLRCHLSTFQKHSVRVPKDKATALHSLNGRSPVDLVLRRHEREALTDAVQGGLWRVAPGVAEAVGDAVRQYHSGRAPIIALPPVQRLGFLDEHDHILCVRDLIHAHPGCPPRTVFRAGRQYRLTSATTKVVRRSTRTNAAGEKEPVELTGSELVLRITDEAGCQRPFLDPRVLHPHVGLPEVEDRDLAFDLRDLIAHFEIPDVPDLAAVNPEHAEASMRRLAEFETLIATMP